MGGRRNEGGERRQGENKERGWTNYQEVRLEEDEGRNRRVWEGKKEEGKEKEMKEKRNEEGRRGKKGKWEREIRERE